MKKTSEGKPAKGSAKEKRRAPARTTLRKAKDETASSQNRVIEGINRILQESLLCETEEQLVRVCLEVAKELTGSQLGIMALVSEKERADVTGFSQQDYWVHDTSIQKGASGLAGLDNICARVFSEKKSLLTNDPTSLADLGGVVKEGFSIQSLLALPLITSAKPVGIVAVANRDGGYRKEDLAVLEVLKPVFVEVVTHKRAETETRKMAQFPQSNPNPVLRVDGEGTILYVNPPAQRMLETMGWRAGTPLPKPLHRNVTAVLRSGTCQEIELTGTNEHAWAFSLSPNVTAGEVNIYARDVTAMRQAEDELKRRNEELETARAATEYEKDRLDAVMSALPVGVAITDSHGAYDGYNAAFEQIWGGESVDGRGSCKAWWADTGKPVAPGEWASAQAAEKNRPVTGQLLEIERFDGSRRFILNSAAPVHDSDGRIIGSAVALQDVTELRNAEEAIIRAKREWQSVFDSVPDLITILDTRHRVVRANRAMADHLGVTPQECIGMECFRGVHGTGAPPSYCPHRKTLADGQAHTAEIHEEKLGGDFLISCTPIFDEKGKMTGSVHIAHDITERRRIENDLRESEERLRLAQEAAGIEIWDFDPRSGVMECNARVKAWWGLSPESTYTYDRWLEGLHPEDREAAVANVRRSLEPEGPGRQDMEYRVAQSDGSYRWLSVRAQTHFEDTKNGRQAVRVIGAMQDVTERKRAEEALRQARDELERRVEERTAELRQTSLYARSLIETSLDPLLTISPDGRITDVNRAMETETGVARSELVGSDFSEYFTDPGQAKEGYQRVLSDGELRDYPLTIRHISGSTTDVLYNAAIYRNEAGEVQGVFAAARDVTQRKRTEDALRRSEALLEKAQRIARLGSWEWNLVTNDLVWSDQVFHILGLSPQDPAPTYPKYLELVHPDDRGRLEEHLRRVLDGEEVCNIKYRVLRRDGEIRTVHGQGELHFAEDGTPAHMVGTVMDITEQARAEEEARARQQQLVQADKVVSLGILVSGVAHEINNPNHAIMSNMAAFTGVWENARPILDRFHRDFGDFVLGGYEYSAYRDTISRMLTDALANSRRIEVIVNELRDFARHSPEAQMTALDVNSVVKSATVLISNLVQKSTDRFSIVCADNLPLVRGNHQRLEQVVINLVQNACHALPSRDKGICVTTSFTPDGGTVAIEVYDEGIGISEENLKHLADPFFTTKRAIGGTGLGLWVSFNIAYEHGGTLTFSSKQGEWTRAVLEVPIAEQHEAHHEITTKEGSEQ